MNGSSLDTWAPVSVLLASPLDEDHASLREILTRSRWRLFETRTCHEALALIQRHGVPIVICERTLPDGDWRTLLGATVDMPQRPQIIVTSRLADHHLWADVLSLGGYDVLMTPFDAGEVSRVVFLAWFSSRRGQTHGAVAPATAA
jgi:DNA-binding NtrC family response regulator